MENSNMDTQRFLFQMTEDELREVIRSTVAEFFEDLPVNKNTDPPSLYMTSKEVAKEFRTTENALCAMRKRLIGPEFTQRGGRYYYERKKVEEYYANLRIVKDAR